MITIRRAADNRRRATRQPVRTNYWQRGLGLLVLTCALAACNRQDIEMPTTPVNSGEAQKAQGNAGIDTVVVSSNGAFVGAELDEKGEILTPQRTFAPDTSVFVSVPSKGRRLRDRVDLYWFHEDGRSRKEETKRIEGPFTGFEFKPTELGKYNVEVDVNNRPIALVEFEVK